MINKILATFDFSGYSPEQYSETMKSLDSSGLAHPKGRSYHLAILKDGNIKITEVWESEEELNDFTRLFFEILIKNAVTPVKPTLEILYNIISI